MKKKLTDDQWRTLSERRIYKVLERLNDIIPNKKNKCKGLWISGGLEEGNSLEITWMETTKA